MSFADAYLKSVLIGEFTKYAKPCGLGRATAVTNMPRDLAPCLILGKPDRSGHWYWTNWTQEYSPQPCTSAWCGRWTECQRYRVFCQNSIRKAFKIIWWCPQTAEKMFRKRFYTMLTCAMLAIPARETILYRLTTRQSLTCFGLEIRMWRCSGKEVRFCRF